MNISELPKITTRSAKRVGRGIGSGRGGHTSGRGTKGQKARGDVRIFFEGSKMKKSLIKRLPFQRGKSKLKSWSADPVVVTLASLEKFTGKIVTIEALLKQGIVAQEALERGVKVLGHTDLKQALTVKVPASRAATLKITKAGGKMEI